MTLFDLVFALLFLAAAVTLLKACWEALRGRTARSRMLLRRCGIGAVIYLPTVALVSLVSAPRVVALGADQCSDDWCITVAGSHRQLTPDGVRLMVDFRLSSRARAVSQRERFVVVYLRDRTGTRYDPLATAGDLPFDTLLGPEQVVMATRTFIVPGTAGVSGVVVAREGAGRFPGCCIIGDEGSLLHKATIARIE